MSVEYDYEEMRDRIANSLHRQLKGMIGYHLIQLARVCESPIEVALGAAILAADQIEHPNPRQGYELCSAAEIESYREYLALMIPQFPLHGYRIDFALRVPRYRFKFLLIECDGHDFHERTKEQAARDRAKDRSLQQDGMPVLRFTGSEIHRDAGACAAEIQSFLENRYDDFIGNAA